MSILLPIPKEEFYYKALYKDENTIYGYQNIKVLDYILWKNNKAVIYVDCFDPSRANIAFLAELLEEGYKLSDKPVYKENKPKESGNSLKDINTIYILRRKQYLAIPDSLIVKNPNIKVAVDQLLESAKVYNIESPIYIKAFLAETEIEARGLAFNYFKDKKLDATDINNWFFIDDSQKCRAYLSDEDARKEIKKLLKTVKVKNNKNQELFAAIPSQYYRDCIQPYTYRENTANKWINFKLVGEPYVDIHAFVGSTQEEALDKAVDYFFYNQLSADSLVNWAA
jgi:hypothetical protein